MSKRSESFGEHVAGKTASTREYREEQLIRETLEEAHRRQVYNDYDEAYGLAVEYLIPTLLGDSSRRGIINAGEGIRDSRVYKPSTILQMANGERMDEQAIADAIESLESLAVHEEIVNAELRNFAPARGMSLPMGRLYKSPRYHAEQVQLVSYHSGETKTLYHGETGEGKSTALSNGVADRWHASCTADWFDGKTRRSDPIKIIDFLDTDSVENGVYDIPQQQDVLQKVRQQLELPPDYTAIGDFAEPDLEILVPLTQRLGDEEIPMEPDSGDSPITPFTIPASELTKRSLKHAIAGSTEQQQSIIGMAYDRISGKKDDWTLQDLGEELLRIEGASDSFKERALNKIVELQRAGFIRDKSCPYRIDWDAIFEDTSTITSFTQKFMDETEQKLMVLMYLVYSLYWEREARNDLPSAVVVGRELHEIVPHSVENNGTEREQSLRNAMVGELSYIMKKNRKQSLELIFDTQDITDLKRGPRKRFNRAITFQTHEDAMEELFGKVAGDKSVWREHKSAIQSTTTGRGTVVGKTKPNDDDGTVFMANIQFAPPPWHVFDDDEYETGLHERVAYTDEEWCEHEFDTQLPGKFMFDVKEIQDTIEAEDRDNEADIKTLKKMHRQEARRLYRTNPNMTYADIAETIPDNPKTGNEYSTTAIGNWVGDISERGVEKTAT